MAFQLLSLKFIGIKPLIHHRGDLANPLDPYAKEMKKVTSKRKKTDADYEQLSRLEFLGSLYMDGDGPIIPAQNIEACLVDSAKKEKKGPETKAGLFCINNPKLIYDGPQQPEDLWGDPAFRLVSGVVVQRNRIFRTRPMFPNWSLVADLEFNDELMDRQTVVGIAHRAGQIIGLGDWRPRYGRFNVEEV